MAEIDLPKVDQSLITREPCAPPCWQGISPGETTLDQAEAILKTLPFIDRGTVTRQTAADSSQNLLWHSTLSHPGDWIGSILTQQNVVDTIQIRKLEADITLDDLIAVYGEPTEYSVVLTPPEAPPCFSVTVIWPEDGLIVAFPSIHSRDAPEGAQLITLDTPVVGLRYESASSVADIVDGPGTVPWTGPEDVRR
jgi:hypothetical protein